MAKKPIPKKTSPAQVMSAAPAASIKAITAELPYAIIQYATNNSLLYPLDAAQGTTATLTLPAGSIQVIVHFAIKGQSCATFAPIHVASGNVADIPWQWISTCIGHTVLIWYEAVVGGKREESLVLELEIQDVREGDLRESMPEFAHAELEWGTRWLNMFKFMGNETIQVKAWPMIRPGSRLFIVVAGNEQNVPPLFKWVAFDHVVTEEEAREGYVFEFELLRGWLARLDDYSSCTCHLGVIWDGCEPDAPVSDVNPLPRNAQDFHQRSTVLLRVDPTPDLLAPGIREAVDCGVAGWLINPTNTVSGAHLVIAYDGMAPGDVVCPHLSGTPGAGSPPFPCHTVQPGETSLVFPVPPSAISANFGKPVTASYTVSFNGLGPWPSPFFTATVLEPTEFPKPYIEQVTAGVLDLKTFNDDATVVVPIWDYAAVGQCVWVWISGTSADGSPYLFYILMDEPLTTGWLANGVDAPISRAELQELEDCSDFELHAAVSFDGKCDLATAIAFPAQTFKIEQEPLVLLEAKVTEAVGPNLTAYNGRNGVHVEVKYAGSNPNHCISVCWKRPDGSCWPLTPKPGSTTGAVFWLLPPEAVIESMGKVVEIIYTVTTACKVQTSPPLNLNISLPVRLETPNVRQGTPPRTQNAILDTRTFTGNAESFIDWMWFLRAGQKCWLRATAIDKTGAPYSFVVYAARTITEGEEAAAVEVAAAVLRSELDKAKDQSSMTLTYSVVTDGSGLESNAIVCPSRVLIIRVPFYDHTSFDPADGGWNGWQRGAGATDPRDLVLVSGPLPWGLGYWLRDWGYTNTSNPATQSEKMFKIFIGLDAGRTYTYEAWIRDDAGIPFPPRMVLTADGKDVTAVREPGTAWELLKGTFVATSNTVRLGIDNRRMGINGANDFAVTRIMVFE
ncbi:hypothetical protein [Pseudomonas sp. GXZC]|uniref:hypothetical protein n=1 Tax=Pseudomonas sp. GXZC TaxID=3003351 RepID=UPI0022AAE648|nr:hypothetical protein [Pseudomonas sp. GXZC]WAT27007.1 hypothetical protein OZ428_23940 [Pseudomonas sp. GXZC]